MDRYILQQQKKKEKKKKSKHWEGENLISRVTSQFSTKNHKAYKEQENMAHSKEQNKFIEIVHKEVKTSVSLDKDFKTTALSVLKELK